MNNLQIAGQPLIKKKRTKAGQRALLFRNSDNPTNVIDRAEPIAKDDPLHYVALAGSVVGLALCVGGTFFPAWFTAYTITDEMGGHIGYVENVVYSLMQISKCYRSPKDVRLCYEDDYLSGGVHKFVIGTWVLAEQVLVSLGTALITVSILLQSLNLGLVSRNLYIHIGALLFIAFAGFVVLVAGIMANYFAVGKGPLTYSDGDRVFVNPIGSGLLLFGSVVCACTATVIGVALTGPGPMSCQSQFVQSPFKAKAQDLVDMRKRLTMQLALTNRRGSKAYVDQCLIQHREQALAVKKASMASVPVDCQL